MYKKYQLSYTPGDGILPIYTGTKYTIYQSRRLLHRYLLQKTTYKICVISNNLDDYTLSVIGQNSVTTVIWYEIHNEIRNGFEAKKKTPAW